MIYTEHYFKGKEKAVTMVEKQPTRNKLNFAYRMLTDIPYLLAQAGNVSHKVEYITGYRDGFVDAIKFFSNSDNVENCENR